MTSNAILYDFSNTFVECLLQKFYMRSTVLMPRIWKPVAITLAVASHSNNLPIFTLITLPKRQIKQKHKTLSKDLQRKKFINRRIRHGGPVNIGGNLIWQTLPSGHIDLLFKLAEFGDILNKPHYGDMYWLLF